MSRIAPRCVAPEDLNVAPAVLGLPLASPGRRLAAMLVDLSLIGMVSSFGNVWMLAGLGVLGLDHERALRGRAQPSSRPVWWAAGALLVIGGLVQGMLAAREAPRPARSEASARAASALAEAVRASASGVVAAAVPTGRAGSAATPAGTAGSAAASAEAAGSAPASADASGSTAAPAEVSGSAGASVGAALKQRATLAAAEAMAERIATLEEQLAAACPPAPPSGFQATVARWLDELGLGYGWALLYFSLLPAWWGGQTPGKRLLGLRVVELTGKPMTALRCLKRFGGYAAGMATGLLGFAQVMWDSNRQGIQDKTAHTVVVSLGPPAPASAGDQR